MRESRGENVVAERRRSLRRFRQRAALIVAGLGLTAVLATASPALAAWSIVPSPNLPGAYENDLNGVSCSSSTACVAVGHATITRSTPLAETLSGGAWSAIGPPLPAGAVFGNLESVSCWSETGCIAVGFFEPSPEEAEGEEPLIESWNGSTWSIMANPSIKALLGSVSCVSAKVCIAVGGTLGLGGAHPLAERWNGKSWSLLTPASESTPTPFNAVSCSGAKACTAVGAAMAQRWNGEAWSSQAVAGTPTLISVSCVAAKVCESVGQDFTGVVVSAAEGWNGTEWKVQTPAGISGEKASRLYGVSCPTTKACTATGYWTNASSEQAPYANFWNGTGWSLESPPAPEGGDSRLNAVSCASSSECIAVGEVHEAGFSVSTLIESKH